KRTARAGPCRAASRPPSLGEAEPGRPRYDRRLPPRRFHATRRAGTGEGRMAADAETLTAPPLAAPARAQPTASRIEALDFVRGVALFGILYMNVVAFGLPYAYANPANAGGADGANLWVWAFGEIFVEGTQRGLFSLLFGASAILLTSRLEAAGRRDAADIYARRNLWLIVFGLVDAYLLLWPGDILFLYGLAALALHPFRNMAPGRLIACGLAVLLVACAWNAHETGALLAS